MNYFKDIRYVFEITKEIRTEESFKSLSTRDYIGQNVVLSRKKMKKYHFYCIKIIIMILF